MTEQLMDSRAALAELGRIKLADTDLQGVLDRIAELAKVTLEGAAEVSVTLVRDKRAHTAAFTGRLALDLDERQYEQGHGPCLDAAATQALISLPDMRTEERWPDYTPIAVDRGALSSLSIGLAIQDTVDGALNVYATEVEAFDEAAHALGATFAEYAAVALGNANIYETTMTLAQQMQAAMAGRAVIEQAKGIIMGERRCTANEAFSILSRLSQDANLKLRDVAAALVEKASQRRT